MVKKLQKMASKKAAPAAGFNPAALLDGQAAQNVRDSAQQIWAAGLAAFSKAQGEGSKVFDTLVKEGMTLQKKTQSLAETKFGAVANKMSGMAGEVGAKAGQHWDKLETIFEERVSRALKSLGVPNGTDVSALISRIDALSAAIGFAPAKKAAAKPVAKPAAKKPVAKKAAMAKKVEKAVAPVKKAVVKKAAAVKTAVAKKAAPAKKAAVKAVAEVKKAAPRKAKATVAKVSKAVDAAKEAVQA